MSTNIAFNLNRFTLRYKVAGEWTSNYGVYPEAKQGGVSPFNSDQTPFLLPEKVEDFGGQISIESASSASVWFTLTAQFVVGGKLIVNAKGYDIVKAEVTPPVDPGQQAICGYTPIIELNPWVFKGSDLPLLTPVLMRLGLLTYADDQHTNLLHDNDPSNNEVSIWVMRTAG